MGYKTTKSEEKTNRLIPGSCIDTRPVSFLCLKESDLTSALFIATSIVAASFVAASIVIAL